MDMEAVSSVIVVTMRFSRQLSSLFLFGVCCLSLSCHHEVTIPQGDPQLILEMGEVKPEENRITVVLTVTNAGPNTVTIPRLLEGCIEGETNCFGYNVGVKDTTKEATGEWYGLMDNTRSRVTRKQFIDLRAGESFCARINIAGAKWSSADQRDYNRAHPDFLWKNPGSYTAEVDLNVDDELLPSWRGVKGHVWSGGIMSNKIHFSIPRLSKAAGSDSTNASAPEKTSL